LTLFFCRRETHLFPDTPWLASPSLFCRYIDPCPFELNFSTIFPLKGAFRDPSSCCEIFPYLAIRHNFFFCSVVMVLVYFSFFGRSFLIRHSFPFPLCPGTPIVGRKPREYRPFQITVIPYTSRGVFVFEAPSRLAWSSISFCRGFYCNPLPFFRSPWILCPLLQRSHFSLGFRPPLSRLSLALGPHRSNLLPAHFHPFKIEFFSFFKNGLNGPVKEGRTVTGRFAPPPTFSRYEDLSREADPPVHLRNFQVCRATFQLSAAPFFSEPGVPWAVPFFHVHPPRT